MKKITLLVVSYYIFIGSCPLVSAKQVNCDQVHNSGTMKAKVCEVLNAEDSLISELEEYVETACQSKNSDSCISLKSRKNKLKNIHNDDFLVNPVIFCKRLKPIPSEPKYINTYKILINAGMPKRAEHLRRIFQSSTDIDLATEPISASLKP